MPASSVKITPKSFIQKYSIILNKKSTRNKKRISDADFEILKSRDYNQLDSINYRVPQLRIMCKHYGLKASGNKDELLSSLYNFLRLSESASPIQKCFRAFIVKQYALAKGPKWKQPKCWVNQEDFLTFTNWQDIPPLQYFTYENDINHVYGFDIVSLTTYISKTETPENPYTREAFPESVIERLRKVSRISSILNFDLNLGIHIPDPDMPSLDESVQLRTTNVFQTMDGYNHYTNSEWFSELSKESLITFLKELADIWQYRAGLPPETRREICPPHGNPFIEVRINQLPGKPLLEIKRIALGVIEFMINRGVTNEMCGLGVYYVLTGLTIVSSGAATAYPWLYDSVAQHNAPSPDNLD